MPITADQVKQLRDMTGAGMMECKKALAETGGDLDRAVDALRKSGAARAEQRSGRAAQEGRVDSYIHPGNRVGVLIEVNCETDFVARTDDFRGLAKHIAQQVAAMDPKYVSRGDVPAGVETQDGEVLMEQEFIRQSGRTIEDLVKETIAKVGENVVVRRFTRYELGV